MTQGRASSEKDSPTDRLAEGDFRQREETFRLLLDRAGDCFFVHDLKGRFIDVNQQACKSLGYTRQELLSRTIADIDVGIEPEALERNLKVLASGEAITVEGTLRRKDGTTFPVETTASLMEQEGNSYVLAIARDITERKEAEEEWRLHSDRLEELVRDRTTELAQFNTGCCISIWPAVVRRRGITPAATSESWYTIQPAMAWTSPSMMAPSGPPAKPPMSPQPPPFTLKQPYSS